MAPTAISVVGSLVGGLAAFIVVWELLRRSRWLAATAVVLGVTLANIWMRWPALLPVSIVTVAALVPYPVAFVGKTPFGVVTVVGSLAALALCVVLRMRAKTTAGRGSVPTDIDWILRIQVVWIFVELASAAFAPDHRVTLNAVRQHFFAVPGCYLAGKIIGGRSERAIRLVVGAYGVIAVLAIAETAVGFSPYHYLPHISSPLQNPGDAFRFGQVRVRLGLYHASDLSRLLVTAYPFVIAETVRQARSWWVRLAFVAIPLAVLRTFTFQAYAALVVVVLVMVLVVKREALVFLAPLSLVVLLGSSGSLMGNVVAQRIHPVGANLTEQQYRAALLPAAVAFASRHAILGAGPGRFNLVGVDARIDSTSKVVLVDDSTIASQLVEVGYPGVVLLVLMVASVLVVSFRRRHRGYWAAVFAAAVGWLIFVVLIDALAGDQSLAPVWLLIGLGVGASTNTVEANRQSVLAKSAFDGSRMVLETSGAGRSRDSGRSVAS